MFDEEVHNLHVVHRLPWPRPQVRQEGEYLVRVARGHQL